MPLRQLRAIPSKISAAVARSWSWTRDHKRRTTSYLKAWPRWIWIWRVISIGTSIGILITLIFPLVVLFMCPEERCIRLTGLVLQLAGIGTVWWGLQKTRKLFGHPSLWAHARDAWNDRPRYGGRAISAVGTRDEVSLAVREGPSVWRIADPDASVETRVKTLEQNLEGVSNALSSFHKDARGKFDQQKQQLELERQDRQREDKEIREKLTLAHTGGLELSAMGACWLFVGVIMATVPAELASIFGP